MKYKIYQVFYEKNQEKYLNEEFVPFDNTLNSRPDLMEYHLFKVGYKRALSEKLSHWGFFSWKWQRKTKVKPNQFIEFIENNPDQDVYLINWCPYIESWNFNIWTHAELYHPGIVSIVDQYLKKMNYISLNDSVLNMFMSPNYSCLSSYFIGSAKFWAEYLQFLNKFKNTIDTDNELKSLVYTKVNYNEQTNYSFFPFIVERLFSTFLVLNKRKYKILNYPSDFSIYKKYIGENYKELEKSFKIKLNMIEKENKDLYFNEWKKQLIKIKSSMPIIPIPDLD